MILVKCNVTQYIYTCKCYVKCMVNEIHDKHLMH